MTAGLPDSGQRTATVVGRLARLGFADASRASQTASLSGLADVAWLDALADAADPDLALAGVADLLEAAPDRDQILTAMADDDVRRRFIAVLGASQALGEHLARHPEHWPAVADSAVVDRPEPAEVRSALLSAVGADGSAPLPVASGHDQRVLDALRVAYRRQLLGIAVRDLTDVLLVDETAADLADLAAATLEAGLAIGRAEVGAAAAASARLSVVAMGKCGGRELNYVSDVDVVYVAEPADGTGEADALAVATRLASALQRACSTVTSEGSIWEVDAALRPEGKAGPLVRTLASHVAYYQRWASTWEFQALLKARPVAGDPALGAAYVEALAPMVWEAAARPGFVGDVQAMRRKVESAIPPREVDRQLKLGPGGLRDVEFSVQLLQLVHGRSDVLLHSGTTLEALEALSTHGYVGRSDAAELDRAYRFMRTLEHRMQLVRLRRTHVVPENDGDLRRIARSMGYRRDPAKELTTEWRRHRGEVRRLHEKLFYRPLLQAVAQLDVGEARLTPEAAETRLEALGYAGPADALRHIESLTRGVSRRAAIQRTLLPVLMGWFAQYPDPDAGLLGFRRISDALGSTPWYLRLLRDSGVAAERLARILATSRYATDLLLRAPEAVAMLEDDDELAPRSRAALIAEVLATSRRYDDPEEAARAIRAVRRRELFRISAADLLGRLDIDQVGEGLTDVAAATLNGGLDAAVRRVEALRGSPLPTRVAVIAMGRLGGHEIGYGSDADVMFVIDPVDGADERDSLDAAGAVANELTRLLAIPAPDPPLEVDADLRPEGKNGPLVRTLASYAAYYERWSEVWERQALLRAEPIAGDADLGARFISLVDPLRYAADGLTEVERREIRRIKARIEAERIPRGADPSLHTKLGRGGLADVEWAVQVEQLAHASAAPLLRTTRTLPALHAGRGAGLLTDEQASTLEASWRLASRVRNATMLVRGRASDSFPVDVRDLAGVARLVGYAPGHTGDLVEDYRRTTRRARAVVEGVLAS